MGLNRVLSKTNLLFSFGCTFPLGIESKHVTQGLPE
jgi:hypothetical protein